MADQPLDLSRSTGQCWQPADAHSRPWHQRAAHASTTGHAVGNFDVPDVYRPGQPSNGLPVDYSTDRQRRLRMSVDERISIILATDVDPCAPGEQERRRREQQQFAQQQQQRAQQQQQRARQQQQQRQRHLEQQAATAQREAWKPRIRSIVCVPQAAPRAQHHATGEPRAASGSNCRAHGCTPDAQGRRRARQAGRTARHAGRRPTTTTK